MTSGEQRALNWQIDRRKRREFKRSLQAHLKAPESTRITLEENWEPLNNLSSLSNGDQWEDLYENVECDE